MWSWDYEVTEHIYMTMYRWFRVKKHAKRHAVHVLTTLQPERVFKKNNLRILGVSDEEIFKNQKNSKTTYGQTGLTETVCLILLV